MHICIAVIVISIVIGITVGVLADYGIFETAGEIIFWVCVVLAAAAIWCFDETSYANDKLREESEMLGKKPICVVISDRQNNRSGTVATVYTQDKEKLYKNTVCFYVLLSKEEKISDYVDEDGHITYVLPKKSVVSSDSDEAGEAEINYQAQQTKKQKRGEK